MPYDLEGDGEAGVTPVPVAERAPFVEELPLTTGDGRDGDDRVHAPGRPEPAGRA